MVTDKATSCLLKGKLHLLKVPRCVLVVYKSADDVCYALKTTFSLSELLLINKL